MTGRSSAEAARHALAIPNEPRDSPIRVTPLDRGRGTGHSIRPCEAEMQPAILSMAFLSGIGLVALARLVPSHAALLEWLGGLLLVVGLVALGFGLAQHGG